MNGVFFNPANAGDSRSRWDINLFSIDGYAGNNQNSLSFKDITKSSFNSDSLKSILLRGNGSNLNAMARVDILGPSVLFNAGARTGIALTTRARVFGNARDINGRLSRAVIDAGEAKDIISFQFRGTKIHYQLCSLDGDRRFGWPDTSRLPKRITLLRQVLH